MSTASCASYLIAGRSEYVGGTPTSQKEFLETLSDPSDPRSLSERRKGKVPPIANQFALGYTYVDVLDADHEGTALRGVLLSLRVNLSCALSNN